MKRDQQKITDGMKIEEDAGTKYLNGIVEGTLVDTTKVKGLSLLTSWPDPTR